MAMPVLETERVMAFIGRSGLIPWQIDGTSEVVVAYLLAKSHWSGGLGTEIARALVSHGFDMLGYARHIALIDRAMKPRAAWL